MDITLTYRQMDNKAWWIEVSPASTRIEGLLAIVNSCQGLREAKTDEYGPRKVGENLLVSGDLEEGKCYWVEPRDRFEITERAMRSQIEKGLAPSERYAREYQRKPNSVCHDFPPFK